MNAPRVALVTCASIRELSDDDRPLLGELWRLGIKAEAAVWDDPSADWSGYDAAVIRSTWDYYLSPAAFAAWLSRVEAQGLALWNPAATVRANADKSYLKTLAAAGASIVPTAWVARGGAVRLDALLEERGWDEAVVKPVVSASAYRTRRVRAGEPAGQKALDDVLAHSDAMVQPFLPEILAEGEWSFIFLGGEFSHAALKKPGAGDFRVQAEHGGGAVRVEPPEELLERARAAARLVPGCLYARVDGVRRGGELLLLELELTEPSLYLSLAPGAARRLAELISEKARLSPRT